jgi:hypothetical protein
VPRSLKKGRSHSGDRSSSNPSSLVRCHQGPRQGLNSPRQPPQKKAVLKKAAPNLSNVMETVAVGCSLDSSSSVPAKEIILTIYPLLPNRKF